MAGAAFAHLLPAITDPVLANRKYLNLLQTLRARHEHATVVGALPFDVTINPSTGCNLSCPYCEVGKGDLLRPAGLLRKEHHDRIMAPLWPSLFIARYFGTGESLLNPKLPDMIAQGREWGVYSVISTNFSLKLTDAYLDRLMDSGLTLLSVACDGATKENYEKYRVGGQFELVMDNMRRFIARKRARGLQYPLLEWRFLVFSHNEHEVPLARAMAQEMGIDILDFYFGVAPKFEDRIVNDVRKAEQRALQPATSGPAIDAAIRRLDTAFRTLPHPAPKHGPVEIVREASGKCDWLYFATYVYPKGEAAPCCHPGAPAQDMGILQDGVRDVWNNDNYRHARLHVQDSAQATNSLCASCPMPKSKDRQFNHVLSAIFRNAPAWFLKLIAVDGDYWLHPLDRVYLPEETGKIDANRDVLSQVDCSAFLDWLQTAEGDVAIMDRMRHQLT